MRVSVPLFAAVILSVALAAPSLAVVRASGLAVSATGAATVSKSPGDVVFTLSNIGNTSLTQITGTASIAAGAAQLLDPQASWPNLSPGLQAPAAAADRSEDESLRYV